MLISCPHCKYTSCVLPHANQSGQVYFGHASSRNRVLQLLLTSVAASPSGPSCLAAILNECNRIEIQCEVAGLRDMMFLDAGNSTLPVKVNGNTATKLLILAR